MKTHGAHTVSGYGYKMKKTTAPAILDRGTSNLAVLPPILALQLVRRGLELRCASLQGILKSDLKIMQNH
jgi:hypothetical protein